MHKKSSIIPSHSNLHINISLKFYKKNVLQNFCCRYCGNAKFIVKIDDDVKINMNAIHATLSRKYGNGNVPDIIECPSGTSEIIRT